MKSGSNPEAALEKQENSQVNKFQAVELTLTHDQFAIIQHFMPKGYSLLEKKTGKRDKGLSQKYADNEVYIVLWRTYRVFQEDSKIRRRIKADRRETEPRKLTNSLRKKHPE